MPARSAPGLAATVDRLRCPYCGERLLLAGGSVACPRRHSYDVARHGYVSLLSPRRQRHAGDSSEMVAARDRFLAAGHYAPIAQAIVAAAREALGSRAGRPGCVVELGAGTAYHLASLLEALPDWSGLALDASRPALRRAASASPRIGPVACDVWESLPLLDGAADLAIDVFAPRNGPEIARVLAPDGALIVVTPTARHLRELIPVAGMLTVDARKGDRVLAQLSPLLSSIRRREVEFGLQLGRDHLRALVAMGPSAHHVDPDELEARLARLPDPASVSASVMVETFARAAR